MQLIRLYFVLSVVRSIHLLDRFGFLDPNLGLVRIEMEIGLLTLMFLHIFWVQ